MKEEETTRAEFVADQIAFLFLSHVQNSPLFSPAVVVIFVSPTETHTADRDTER